MIRTVVHRARLEATVALAIRDIEQDFSPVTTAVPDLIAIK